MRNRSSAHGNDQQQKVPGNFVMIRYRQRLPRLWHTCCSIESTELKKTTGFHLNPEHVLTLIVMTVRKPQPDKKNTALRCFFGGSVGLII